MFPYFTDYYWKDGQPVARDQVSVDQMKGLQEAYRFVHDSYHKHLTLEHYKEGRFAGVIYDSRLLDYRHLKNEAFQHAWRKERLEETESQVQSVLFDETDRVAMIETYRFEEGRCISCEMTSPHGIPVGTQRLYYDGPFIGVVLFDANDHPVLAKRYRLGPDQQFSKLEETIWNLDPACCSIFL